MTESLQIILYVLGAILLMMLIVLTIKLIGTLNKLNEVIDDVNRKVKTLDGFFSLIDYTTEKITSVSDKISNFATSIIRKVSGKTDDLEEREENENE